MATENLVLTEKKDGLMTIILNRPDKRNAINLDMGKALIDAIADAADDKTVRVVALRGAGKCFCAGIDFNMLAELNAKFPTPPQFRFHLNEIQRIFNDMERLEKPVIALLHNFTYGMGTEMALAADFRIATPDLKIGIQEVELGLIPDVGGTTRLTRLIGTPVAKEMIMTARVLDAAEAYHVRLVNEIAESGDLDAALAVWVERLRGCAPLAVGIAKKLIDRCSHMDKLSFMELEGLAQSSLLSTSDVQEGVMARIQKRKPEFKGK